MPWDRDEIIGFLEASTADLAMHALVLIKQYEQKIFELENRLKECENGYEETLAHERVRVIELSQENMGLRSANNRLRHYDEERDIALHARLISETRADTVREMLTRVKALFPCDKQFTTISRATIEQIADEMLEGK